MADICCLYSCLLECRSICRRRSTPHMPPVRNSTRRKRRGPVCRLLPTFLMLPRKKLETIRTLVPTLVALTLRPHLLPRVVSLERTVSTTARAGVRLLLPRFRRPNEPPHLSLQSTQIDRSFNHYSSLLPHPPPSPLFLSSSPSFRLRTQTGWRP